jgi:hypothetical protein
MKNGKPTEKQIQVGPLENSWALTHGEESKNHETLEEMKHGKKILHQTPTLLSPIYNRMLPNILSSSRM